MMNHGSLFSGIGGFDLAASWMGWKNVFQCERDAFCRRVLQYYWPETACYEDVCEFKGERYRVRIDILTGGFPCQPFSTAGKRKGTADNRHLWPEMYRIIREVQPRWVVGENVVGLLNWNRGMVFEMVQADLEAAGYETRAFVLPAAGVGAPHRRDRVWIVANAHNLSGRPAVDRWQKCYAQWKDNGCLPESAGKSRFAANSHRDKRSERRMHPNEFQVSTPYPGSSGSFESWDAWEDFPTQPGVCVGDDGLSAGLDRKALSAWRVESLRGAGNAIVPQVAWRIFKAIEKMEGMT